jgi:hypothetical protein
MEPAMKRFIAATLYLLCCCTPGHATEFVGSYGDWRQLSEESKASYSMGIADILFHYQIAEPMFSFGSVKNLSNCKDKMRLTSELIVRLIDKEYSVDTELQSAAPIIALYRALKKVCPTGLP